MSLALKTNAADVRAIVKYLKTKPTGASLSDIKSADKRLSDGRKITAYINWGIVQRDDGRHKLTARGLNLARHPDKSAGVFGEILSSNKAYRSVIEWAHQQELQSVDTNDVGAHWHEHHSATVGAQVTEPTLRDNAVAFFSLAEAAELGTLTLGRGGKLTRLDINRAALAKFVEAGPASPPWDDADDEAGTDDSEEQGDAPAQDEPPAVTPENPEATGPMRVFISHGSNHDIVEQIEVMLELADIKPEIAIAEETAAIPVPDKVLDAMRRCQAGIIAVTVDETRKDDNGNYTLNENVLIEIGSAFVLYDRKVVLVWDKRLTVPSNLQGLYRCEFEGDELSWSTGMKLMKAIQGFKPPADS